MGKKRDSIANQLTAGIDYFGPTEIAELISEAAREIEQLQLDLNKAETHEVELSRILSISKPLSFLRKQVTDLTIENKRFRGVLKELCGIVQGCIDWPSSAQDLDSFTLQPAKQALKC